MIGEAYRPPKVGSKGAVVANHTMAAQAGMRILHLGGNAVDAACAMLGATSTMWDTLGWGGETQALIYDPNEKKVIGINGLGVAPTGATVNSLGSWAWAAMATIFATGS